MNINRLVYLSKIFGGQVTDQMMMRGDRRCNMDQGNPSENERMIGCVDAFALFSVTVTLCADVQHPPPSTHQSGAAATTTPSPQPNVLTLGL